MIVLVTGGAGFIGSHVAEYYAQRGDQVICYDNLSRAKLLGKSINQNYNWNYLKRFSRLKLVQGDIRDLDNLRKIMKDVNVIIHTAAQTAVTVSLQNPKIDFEVNTLGTFNVLEAARLSNNDPTIIFCSTNKVYGNNVNKIQVIEQGTRYVFEEKFKNGIPETYPIDLCEHTPYGASKLASDLYVQEYTNSYGLKSAVFRMSCIYGVRQFGVEDQGWIAWFTIATILGKPITIYGDGKQVRDVLYISDLINAFDSFLKRKDQLYHGVFNMGGGPNNTLSLLELIEMLESLTGKKSDLTFKGWRPSDQSVYISDVTMANEKLHWQPLITPKVGLKKIVNWVKNTSNILN